MELGNNISTLANVLRKITTNLKICIQWTKYVMVLLIFNIYIYIQWNLFNTDTLGTQIIVMISEVSFFQGQNNMYLFKVGTHSSTLIKQGVLMSEVSFKRGSIVYVAAQGRN